MRIALCANGSSPHSQRWANAVAARGVDVVFVWAQHEFDTNEVASFDPSIAHHVLPGPRLARPWTLPRAALVARRFPRSSHLDLAHGMYLSTHGWRAHALGVAPLVLSALGSDVRDLTRPRGGTLETQVFRAYITRRTRAAVSAADVVLVDSVPLGKAVRDQVPGTATRIVRFGVELTTRASDARARWRTRLGIDDDAFVVLSSRIVKPHYNIDTIVRAMPIVRARIPRAVLVVKERPAVSDPEYRRFCLELVDELGIGEAVRVVGELGREELLDLHGAADVYVSVPQTDGTAVSVFEAMTAGVATVATEAPGIDPQILRRGETALLVPLRDPERLAQAVTMLALEPQLRDTLVANALEIVHTYGDFEREMDRAVLLYEELVRTRTPRPACNRGAVSS